MEHFATKEPLATWSDDQTGAELVAFYNALSGATPTKRFTDRKAAVDRIWKALHVEPMPAGSEGAAGAPRKLAQRTRRKATARKGKRPAPAKGPKRTSRDGGRVDEVLALLRRAGGVTKSELMKLLRLARSHDARLHFAAGRCWVQDRVVKGRGAANRRTSW